MLSRFDELDVAARVVVRHRQPVLDRRQRPDVSERIDDGGDAVAPVGVLRRRADGRAGRDRAGQRRVEIVDAKLEDGAAAAGRRDRRRGRAGCGSASRFGLAPQTVKVARPMVMSMPVTSPVRGWIQWRGEVAPNAPM